MNAQESFERYIQSLLTDIKNMRKHTERVVALCEEFADRYPDAVDRELLLDAAWLHDIAKYRADKRHNSPKRVQAVLEKNELGDEIDSLEAVVDVIAMHKGRFDPWENELECAVLRLCDKLDRFEKGKSDAKKKCRKTLKKIEDSDTLKKAQCKKLKAFYKDQMCTIKIRLTPR